MHTVHFPYRFGDIVKIGCILSYILYQVLMTASYNS